MGFFTKLRRDQRGNVLILTAAVMPLLIAAAGFATDTIQWALWKRQLQRAADSAAIAGVYERNVAEGATAGVPAAVDRDLALNQHAGVLKEAVALAYPADVAGIAPAARKNQVSVTLKLQKPLVFSSFFLSTAPTIVVNATAASVPGGEYCVIALDKKKVVGLEVAGSTEVDIGDCCMIANSTHENQAFRNNGVGSTVKAGCIAAAGGVEKSKDPTWDVDSYNPYSEPAKDPFATLPMPTKADCHKEITISDKQSDYPIDRASSEGDHGKTICITGGLTVPKGTLTLGAATYVLDGGDLTMSASDAKITCDGCTIILTNFTDKTQTGNLKITGGVLDIKAPTTTGATYRGIAIYQDRLAGDDGKRGTNHINGNSTGGVQGVVYTPSRSILYNGGGSSTAICMQLVAMRVDFSGNSKMKMGSECAAEGLNPITGAGSRIRLVA
ncbi:pilus assembly protein TadG-related protein [Sphingomonas sp. GCM10030256]|uniref:pilus assembly protein TadG-related protein n=1 Tax=Sphingomonas sp. GCM10030256 TaxID=3273427 RepID=UPI00361E5E8F